MATIKEMKNILILGHTGFIGKYVDTYLKNTFHIAGVSSSCCNLFDKNSIEQYIQSLNERVTIIFSSSIVRTVENSFDSYTKNVLMADNIGEAIIKSQYIEQVVFLSTIDVYGAKVESILNEESIPNPSDYYSISKLTSEFILKKFCESKQIPLTILRLPGVYGINEVSSTMGKIIDNAKKGNITIFGLGNETRDFLFIADLVKVIEKVIEIQYDGLLNVVSGKSFSILEIAQEVKKLFECTITFKESKNYETRQKNLLFHNEKLKRVTNHNKMVTIVDGLKILQRTVL